MNSTDEMVSVLRPWSVRAVVRERNVRRVARGASERCMVVYVCACVLSLVL